MRSFSTSTRTFGTGTKVIRASPAVGRIESKIETLLQRTEQNSGLERADERLHGFHADIDEARNCIDKHDYQIAELLLQRIKSRSWDKLNVRHKFRVLTKPCIP